MRNYNPGDLLTPGEVAAINRVDPKTVTRWAASGKMPSIRTPGGHRRFYWAAVAAALMGDDPWEALTIHGLPTPARPGNPTPNPTADPAPADPNPTAVRPTGIDPDIRYYLSNPTR